jgi:two-component system sensor kinase FixL
MFKMSLQAPAEDYWSAGLRRMLGVPDNAPASGTEAFIQRFVLAADAERVTETFRRVIARGLQADLEFRIRRFDGQVRTLHVVLAHGRYGADPAPVLLGIVIDETARRELEADSRRLQDRLTDVARTAALGEMASGIAHELNQPLAAIATFAQAGERILSRVLDPGAPGAPMPLAVGPIEKAAGIFKDIATQALRGGDIIRHMRSLMRLRSLEHTEIDLRELMREMQAQFDLMTRGDGSEVRVNAGGVPAKVLADAAELQYVTLLLVQNALEAQRETGKGGCVLVGVDVRPPWVVVTVTDSGPGVAPEKRDLLFKPFFTTKVHGTGLGLASGRAVIDRYRGTVGYDTPPGGGSQFWFKIPCAP